MPSKFLSTPLLVVLGRLAGVLIPFFIAHFYGVSAETDAFFFVLGIILLALETLSHLLESVLVPDLVAHKNNPGKMFSFGNGVLVSSLAASFLFLLLFILASPWLFSLWKSPDPEFSRKITRLLIEMSPFLLLAICTCLANSLFYVHKIFWFPALSPALRSGIVVVTMIMGHAKGGIHAATAGFGAGELVRTGLSFYLLARLTGWRPKLDWKKTGTEIRDFLDHAVFQVLAILAFNLFLVTDQWFAARVGTGNLSLFSYSDRLFLIPYQLFGAGFLHILHSNWSDIFHEKPAAIFWEKIKKDIRWIFAFSFLFSVLAWGLAPQIVRAGFGHGSMNSGDLQTIAGLFGWQMIGFIPAILNLSYSRIFFILKKSRFYFGYSWARFLLKVILNWIFMSSYGLRGIVISTVMVNLTAAGALHFYLKRYLKGRPCVP